MLLVATVLAGVTAGSASAVAEYTTLCPVAPEEECPEESEPYYEGTGIVAKSTDLLLTIENVSLGVDGEIECDSEIKATTYENFGDPLLSGRAEAFTLTGCEDNLSRKCTASVATLPYEATLEADDASSGDGFLFLHQNESGAEPGATMVCEDANPLTPDINCTYTVNENDSQIGAGTADLAKFAVDGAASPSASIAAGVMDEAAGSKCPGSNPTLDATFAISSPTPLYMAAQGTPTKLCETAKINPCEVAYVKDEKWKAELQTGEKVSFQYENKKEVKSFTCSTAVLRGKIGTALGIELLAPAEAWDFSNCSNECFAAMTLNLDARFNATNGGNGYIWVGGRKGGSPIVAVSCKKDLCAYTTASIIGQVTGGTPATMTVKNGKLDVKTGLSEKECGAEVYMGGVTIGTPAKYKFTEPLTEAKTAAMWLSRG